MQVYILGARTSIAVSLLNSVSTFWPELKLWVSRLLNSGVRPRLVTEQGKLAVLSGKEVARMSDVVSRVLCFDSTVIYQSYVLTNKERKSPGC